MLLHEMSFGLRSVKEYFNEISAIMVAKFMNVRFIYLNRYEEIHCPSGGFLLDIYQNFSLVS